jgi:hypothetical protein
MHHRVVGIQVARRENASPGGGGTGGKAGKCITGWRGYRWQGGKMHHRVAGVQVLRQHRSRRYNQE